jgi:hypothetical protein
VSDRENNDVPGPREEPERPRYSPETLGLLILAAVVLIVIVVRYWGHIAWSAR